MIFRFKSTSRRFRARGGLAAVLVLFVAMLLAMPARATDPFDLRPTDLQLIHWRQLDAAVQRWFLVGFSLGWHGLSDPKDARPPDAAKQALAPARAALSALAARPDAAGRRVAAVLIRRQSERPLPYVRLTGETWTALPVRQRFSVLHGFYAGAYGRAIQDELGPSVAEETLERALGKDRRQFRPRLALAPSLLLARLSDWYFYTDRRAEPLVRSIEAIADQIMPHRK